MSNVLSTYLGRGAQHTGSFGSHQICEIKLRFGNLLYLYYDILPSELTMFATLDSTYFFYIQLKSVPYHILLVPATFWNCLFCSAGIKKLRCAQTPRSMGSAHLAAFLNKLVSGIPEIPHGNR